MFSAFAKYLQNPENPIYDQHSARAMWAICGELTVEDKKDFKDLLMKRNDTWKTNGGGRRAVECYLIFKEQIDKIAESGAASKRDIDLLLMPLGQGLKKYSNNYNEFSKLCGWSSAD